MNQVQFFNKIVIFPCEMEALDATILEWLP